MDEDWESGSLGRWDIRERNMMGLTDYPYHACQEATWAKTIALGDRRYSINQFRWDRLVVHFMGLEVYYCKRHWVYKEIKDGLIEENLLIYVEDGRPIGPTYDIFWEALRNWGSM